MAWWVCVCKREIWKPLASGGQSSPKLTPTISASFPMPKKGILTGTYFAKDQVLGCSVFTHVKNKLPSWDKYFIPRHKIIKLHKNLNNNEQHQI